MFGNSKEADQWPPLMWYRLVEIGSVSHCHFLGPLVWSPTLVRVGSIATPVGKDW